MIAAPNPAQSESSKGSLPVKSLVEAVNIDPDDLKSDTFPNGRPSLHKRIPLAFSRFLITFCFGVTATLAWAVLRRRDQRDAREFVPAPSLVGTANPTGCAESFRDYRVCRASRTSTAPSRSAAAWRNIARPRCGAAKRRPALRQSRADDAQCRSARSRSGADDGRDHQTAGDRTVHPLQELRASAAAGVGPGRHIAVVSRADGALMAKAHFVPLLLRSRCTATLAGLRALIQTEHSGKAEGGADASRL